MMGKRTVSTNSKTIQTIEARPTGPWRTSSGVVVGCMCEPRPPALDRDALLLQEALLEPRTAQPLPTPARVLGAFWKWC